MRQVLYLVLDAKVKGFSMPFSSASDAAAARSFGDAVAQKDSLMGKHPADFSLYRVADFDDATGIVTPCVPIVEVIHGRTFVKE